MSLSPKWIPLVDLLVPVSCQCGCIICWALPYQPGKLVNICRNGSRQKRQTRPFLFSTWPKYFGKIAATGMIYIEGCRSVAKIIALVRRDDLQALELCQMTSVTSFEPLSTQLVLKVWRISKEKAFKIFWKLLNFHVGTSPSTKIFDKEYFKSYISYCHMSNSKATTQELCTNVIPFPYLLNFIWFCENMNNMIHWHWKQNRFQTSSRENLSLPLWKLVLSKSAMI